MFGIYEPTGAAREYSPLAINTYSGCTHACRYCYVPAIFRKTAAQFHSSVTPRLGIIEQAAKDVLRHKKNRVHLCFTCDPYPTIELQHNLTRGVLEVLQAAQFPVSVLTKAGTRAMRDLPLLARMDAHLGITLTWNSDEERKKWEPHTASVQERLDLLTEAKRAGITTWVSMEPVINPAEALSLFPRLLLAADIIKVGRWNHSAESNKINWQSFAVQIKRLLLESGKPHLLKKGLAEYV